MALPAQVAELTCSPAQAWQGSWWGLLHSSSIGTKQIHAAEALTMIWATSLLFASSSGSKSWGTPQLKGPQEWLAVAHLLSWHTGPSGL